MKIKKTYLILVAILILHSIFVIISMNQPFHGDEVVYVECAKGILKTGKPIFNYGIMNPNFQGVWHFPLYPYILSGFIYLFGQSIYSVRAVSAIFNIFTIIFVYLITKEILKKREDKENWALLAAFIYAFNPLTIQNSIPTDVDGGLLNFAMYSFLYLFIKNKKIYYLLPSLLFVFLAKEIGPPILFLSILLVYCISLNWKKIPKLIFLFFINGILYLGIWKILSGLLDLDFGMLFRHNLREAGSSNLSFISLLVSAWEFKNFFYFAIPFLIILFLIFTFIFYYKIWKKRELIKQQEIQNILLFNIIALLIILVYFYVGGSSWGFPKYQVIALPSISIFIVCILSKSNILQNIKKNWKTKKWVFILLVIFLVIYFLSFIKNPLIPEIETTAKNANISQAILRVLRTFSLYIIIPLLICWLIFSLMKFKMKFWLTLIFLTLFLMLYLNVLHALVNYSTYNKYGDIGIPEVVNYFKENNISATKIATHVHIGYYLNISEYFEISFAYNVPEIFKKEVVENPEIEYIVIWKRDIERIGSNINYFYLEKKIGTYYIFKKR